MNKTKYFCINLIINFMFINVGYAQTELVKNGSFEVRKPSAPSNTPYASDQMNYCEFWENLNSADWYSDDPDYLFGTTSSPNMQGVCYPNSGAKVFAH